MSISSGPPPAASVSSPSLHHRTVPGQSPTPRRTHSDSYQAISPRAGRPPQGEKLLYTLFHPFARQKLTQQRARETARTLLHQSIATLYDDSTAVSRHEILRQLVKHCKSNALDLDKVLRRNAPNALHPIEEFLRAKDYEALLILAPMLQVGKYDAVYVHRSDNGFYVGEGSMEGTDDDLVLKARGLGVLLRDGQRTEGEWHNNLPNGWVRHFPAKGDLRCYEGRVKDCKMHGRGTAEFMDGRVLRGSWKNNMRDGKGEMTWPSGDRLVATWNDGVIEDGAIFTAQDGRRYEGGIDATTCRPDGTTTLSWQVGPRADARYVGPVQDGVPCGEGSYTFGTNEWFHGFVYEGSFVDGRRHGEGTLLERSTEKKTPCKFDKDVLLTSVPERTPVDEDNAL